MRIGELAAQSGVGIQTLRYYERRGLISEPARRPSGYRDYSPDALRIIRLIKWAQRLGFTLDEIKEIITLIESRAQSGAVRAHAAAKVQDIDERIRNLQSMRGALQSLVDCFCEGKCPIISAALDGEAVVAHSASLA
jgi:DNA-binding transcriptional MerR regulator